jgi:hypothetical protein
VEAAHQALWDLHDAKRTLLSRNAAAEVVAAVVAALRLPERDRETAAKALDEAADRMPAYHDRNSLTAACRWLRARASALRERRES